MNCTNQVTRIGLSDSEEIVFLPFEVKEISKEVLELVKRNNTLKEVV